MRVIDKTGSVKVADEVWIATALLHRENPRRPEFEVSEIVERAEAEGISAKLRPGVYVHALQHCVANRPADPARYRMLFETSEGRRRLFRYPDAYHFSREEGKIVPEKADIPAKYHALVDWYSSHYQLSREALIHSDPLLQLAGSGKELWANEHADEYVRRLREEWK